VGKRTLESGNLELQIRRGQEKRDGGPLDQAAGAVAELWRGLP